MADDVIAADIKQPRSAQQHIGDHQHGEAVLAFLIDLPQDLKHLSLPLHQRYGIVTGDLTDAELMLRDVEFLEVAFDELVQVGMCSEGVGEERSSQLIDRDTGDPRHPFRQCDISFRAGRRFEHHRIGEDGAGHQPGDPGGGDFSVLHVHIRDDGVGAAHRLVPHADRLDRLDISQTVMVDDLQNLRFVEPRDCLSHFVMVYQHHLFPLRTHQVVTGEYADDFLIIIQDRITGVSSVTDFLPYIIDVIIQMETDQVIGDAVMGDRDGLYDLADGVAGIKRSGDDAGVSRIFDPGRVDFRLADDQAFHIHVQCSADDVRLAAAENDGILFLEQELFTVQRQCDHDFSGKRILVAGIVDHPAFQHTQQVEDRDIIDAAVFIGQHVVFRDVFRRKHAVKGSVFVHHRDVGDAVFLDRVPGKIDGNGGVEGGRGVILQVADLCADVPQPHGRFHAEVVQDALCLVVDMVQMSCNIIAVAECIPQGGVCDRGNHGIRIGIFVTGNIDLVHDVSPAGKIYSTL